VGLSLLIADLAFFAAWQRVHGLTPCRGIATGVEIGLATAVVAFCLSIFGVGWKRWMAVLSSIVTFYLWFSWLAWLGQMEC